MQTFKKMHVFKFNLFFLIWCIRLVQLKCDMVRIYTQGSKEKKPAQIYSEAQTAENIPSSADII